MANPLYSQFSNNGMSDLLKRAEQLKNTLTVNPQQEVQRLLNSGKMTQQQFNQFAQIANTLRPFMK